MDEMTYKMPLEVACYSYTGIPRDHVSRSQTWPENLLGTVFSVIRLLCSSPLRLCMIICLLGHVHWELLVGHSQLVGHLAMWRGSIMHIQTYTICYCKHQSIFATSPSLAACFFYWKRVNMWKQTAVSWEL